MNALNAYNRLNANVAGMKKASEKLSSGYRINRAGDDAAGLAVSEKMRSQIRGLNQAIRNSQDGINMIQTFEGAAQETHSILQRMKELATESANGTYDNATDRAAMELEFKQLNDELDQIADTDFNGTIVLNGGQMSDGMYALNKGELLKSDDGSEYLSGLEFDYATGRDLLEAEAEAGATGTVTDFSSGNTNDTQGAEGGNILQNHNYDKSAADEVYKALGIDPAKYADATTKSSKVNVTFQFDGTSWKGIAVTNAADGKIIESADASKITAGAQNGAGTGEGGFSIKAGTYTTNAVFNATEAKKGDLVTFQFENNTDKTYAPKNGTILESSFDNTVKSGTDDVKDSAVNGISFALDAGLTDDAMNQDVKDALDELRGAEFTVTYTAGVGTLAASTTPTAFDVAADGTITSKGGVTLGQITFVDKITEDVPASPEVNSTVAFGENSGNGSSITGGDTAKMNAVYDSINAAEQAETSPMFADGDDIVFTRNNAGKWTANDTAGTNYANDAAMEAALGITFDVANAPGNQDTITLTKHVAAVTEQKGVTDTNAAGTVKFKVDLDTANLAGDAPLKAISVATPDAAKEAAAGGAEEAPLSVSDAFENSTARLTYSNNITLQTGARSKDAVRFTFKYNQDDSVDMRGLDANLNLSSRADGLNTKNLSLATQDEANYAIDQIDKAINKTSMVRATFGAIQNRLEHKITNLTTTSENLTEAESAIRDTDMASEMMNFTKYNILQQAAQSMLAQANQQPQSILQLLG